MATKSEFLAEYEKQIIARYSWASNETKRARFMASVKATLNGGNTWSRDGEAYEAALVACGLSKRITLKALHALPE